MAADHYQVYFGDQARPADDAFHALVDRLEVEENADLPGAFELSMPIAKAALSDELSLIGDERWQPYALQLANCRLLPSISPDELMQGFDDE